MRPDARWMRFWLRMILAAGVTAAANGARAEDDLTVLRPDESPRKMLYRALEGQARDLLRARGKAVAALKTPEAIRQRQVEIRGKFLEALGDLPEKTPLNARVVGKDRRDGYSVERVIYESRPFHHVTAVFYIPDGPGPFPGVLVPCGHSANGKAGETYQRICILLAKNGMAALCYDPIGQGERAQWLDRDGKPAFKASTTEHTIAGIGSLLVGRSLASYRIWDGIRSLDYLASRPEVDPKRLGCTGNSGGGTLTAYLMALDDRIAVAAPSCYITSLERLFATIGPQDAEQNITGQVAFGMDHADYALLRAPKPTLLSVGTQDFFDIDGSWQTFRELKLVFGRLGYGENIDLFESDEPHGFTKPRREAAMRWLRRWLLDKNDAPIEADFAVATDADLQCTKTGQVLSDLHGKSVFQLNAERAEELAKLRSGGVAGQGMEDRLRAVRKFIGLHDSIAPARVEVRGEAKRDGYSVRKLVYETEPGILIPALDCVPAVSNENGRTPRILVGYNEPGEFLRQNESLLKAGHRLVFVHLRGMGETAPSVDGPAGPDTREAFLSLHLNRPLLGQRVADLLSVIAALTANGEKVRIEAKGSASLVALHAAALESKVVASTLRDMPASWAEVVKTPNSSNQLAGAVPGVLALYDLPDLAALIAGRSLTILAPTDGAGRILAEDQVAPAYQAAADAFAKHPEGRLSLVIEPPTPRLASPLRTLDLNRGESQTVALPDGKPATVKLVDVQAQADPIRGAVREATVKVEVNGTPVTLSSGNYNLPVTVAGVQLDCPITHDYNTNTTIDHWGLIKDARIRLWPAGKPWIDPTTFTYPARQRWFATSTQMANEPTYVDGGDKPSLKSIYYHSGLDIGGAEGLVEVVAATDGIVVGDGGKNLPGLDLKSTPVQPRYDVVYLLDDRGWFYRYSHMASIDPAITPGASVTMGQAIGVLGKEGGSGGWTHLHFEIKSRQPSGRWGTEEGYAFLWQTALREQKPDLIAVARPHRLTWTGEPVTLDGSKSWSRPDHPIATFEWTFCDGTTALGPKVERVYDRPGSYSEILKVTDRQGHVDYDFAIVQAIDRAHPDEIPPTVHAAYSPTQGIKPGDTVTFKVRTFRTTDGQETWDFGDGSPPEPAHSDGNVDIHAKDGYAVTTHRFAKPGHYLVRVERADRRGARGTARLHVVVGEP